MAFNRLSLEDKLLTKAVPQGECLVWIGQKHPRGYGRLRIGGKLRPAHRLMYELRHGPIPDGQVVRHSCDNPACINPAHLSIGTQLDNVQDMFERGRANKARGERSPKAKLTEAQVREIRARYVARSYGNGAHVLAREFGVSKPTIQAILSGDSWKHVDRVMLHGCCKADVQRFGDVMALCWDLAAEMCPAWNA
jgi:HNH endonuclease